MADTVSVIGAGLAGCEAAFQLAERGLLVRLYEMKPHRRQPAHKADTFGELVCSNSLRSDRLQNGAGLMKEEMRRLHSLIIWAADETRVPAGGALAVDREGFTRLITDRILAHPNITVIHQEVTALPEPPAIVATGPLTDGPILENIQQLFGPGLHFYDAAAPIVAADSLEMDKVFRASRYERGSDYLNCPMDRAEYLAFVRELVQAETAPLHAFETPRVFEGCMPVEVMANRGEMTLAFGPLKPVGLVDPHTGKKPFAVVQLRQDDAEGAMYNIVGFQTNLKFPEQRRVFGMIPGLAHAEFLRYGVMHRNTFLPSPGKLDYRYSVIERPNLYFAGQITGVEGYVESAGSGLVAGINLAHSLLGKPPVDFTRETALGAMAHYVSGYCGKDFQPMNINFGIMAELPEERRPKKKTERYEAISRRALQALDGIIANKL